MKPGVTYLNKPERFISESEISVTTLEDSALRVPNKRNICYLIHASIIASIFCSLSTDLCDTVLRSLLRSILWTIPISANSLFRALCR
jgi:hypothetical protein